MSRYELSWSMYGTATIEAESQEAAEEAALGELVRYSGFGMDFADLAVDGAEVMDVEATP